MARWSKGIAILVLGGLLGWRILVTGLSDYYAQQREAEAIVGALHWREQQPEALYQRGLDQFDRDPADSERLLRLAAWTNPTDARIYLVLAYLWAAQGRQQAAVELAKFADVLGPVRSPVLIGSADFWETQGRLDRMLARWSMLLRTRPGFARQLYPLLLGFAEDRNRQELLKPLLDDPPDWWDGFFVYAAREAEWTDTVIRLYQQRQRRDEPPAERELSAYLDRLWRDARWQDAYQAWRDSLSERQLKELGDLYNGRFNLPLTGIGFDWRTPAVQGAMVETAPTYGMRGEKALHVVFDGQRVRFQHVLQYLVLKPGPYRLQGRVRPDGLRTERGLQWRIRCAADGPLLAESERFLGSDSWRTFGVDFVVPEIDCSAQVLRLELEGRAALDFEVQGGIWFDDLNVVSPE
ncbi:MAG TPA: hypothetical protein PKY50_14050 [Candidatus Competibacter sp.]|nr:hypothetical protein [Candidatus Competibacter sp.]